MVQLPEKITIAALQWDIRVKDPKANLLVFEKLLEKAISEKANLVTMPEMWSCGFCGSKLPEEAERLAERLEYCADKARQYRIWIAAGSMPEKGPGKKVYNTFFLIDLEGKVRFSYRKIHLFPLTGEPNHFECGLTVPEPFHSGGWAIGAGICFDLRFPELFRFQMKKGANLFFVPSQFPNPRGDHYRLFSQARALENLAYLVSTNRCGKHKTLTFPGKSLFIDPSGNVFSEGSGSEDCVFGVVELEKVRTIRKNLPFLEWTKLL